MIRNEKFFWNSVVSKRFSHAIFSEFWPEKIVSRRKILQNVKFCVILPRKIKRDFVSARVPAEIRQNDLRAAYAGLPEEVGREPGEIPGQTRCCEPPSE